MRKITRGAAANAGLIFHVFVQDSTSTTGAGKASVAFSSFSCRYIRNGEAISGAITPEDITTIGTYAAPTANTNVRIKAVDNSNMIGVYEVQIHLDWVNTTNSCQSLTIQLTASGAAPVTLQIPLEADDAQIAKPANYASLSIDASGRVDIGKLLGTAWLTPGTAGTPDVNVKLISDDATAADNAELFFDGTGYAGGTTKLKVDLETIKTQAVTCAGAVTVSAFVGATGAAINGTNVNTLSSHDPGATLGTSTLTQTQVTGGAYALNSASFSFNAAVPLTTQQKADVTAAVPTVGAVADQVWDELIAGHLGAGSTGAALNAAGSAGDPWSTPLPGAYGAGTAGKIVGDNLDAAVSSRLATVSYTAAPTATQNADALLDRDMAAVTVTNSRSPINALRFIRNGFSISGATLTVLEEDDATPAYTRTLTSDPSADPITGIA